ncbi:diaminopimelate epimerase [Methylocystis bryophila]|uniref:Diaminopimelate epimerase n=1 Tax=Methylocystis bryophila TaxID=655015 RepID=A0A1W6MQ79_9HYPH|nr:diaminopimelate epimerase [Methylocystis bryophila]ARN79744.1 diaminopimelate epimerase [Methylocystis bryophila]
MPHALAGRPVLRMNGAGNEILVLDLRGAALSVSPQEARAIATQAGLAYDQLMVIHDPRERSADAALTIYNVDGSLSAACGNGTRCAAFALARAEGAPAVVFETDAGRVASWREEEFYFRVDMGRPRLAWREIPLARDVGDLADVALDPPVPGAPARFSAVGMGNPHAVFFVADAEGVDLLGLGPKIERHPLFPERVNVSFAEMRARDDILLRVFERGVGPTKACGSAACATLVAAAQTGRAERRARVRLPGGDLTIEWRDDDHVHMSGPVALEFETTLAARTFEGLAA